MIKGRDYESWVFHNYLNDAVVECKCAFLNKEDDYFACMYSSALKKNMHMRQDHKVFQKQVLKF